MSREIHALHEKLLEVEQVQFVTVFQPSLQCGPQEVGDRDARNFDRVLEGHEHAGLGALVRLHLQQVFSMEVDRSAGGFVGGVAGDDFGQGNFFRTRSGP